MFSLELLEYAAVVVGTVAGMFWLLTLPCRISDPEVIAPNGKPVQTRFWRMMFVRAAIISCLAYFLASPNDHPFAGGAYPVPDTSKGAAVVTIVVIAADALWDIFRRGKTKIRRR